MQHLEAVGKCIKLGFASFRSVTIIHDHILDLQIVIDRMDGHLRLNLKPGGQHRKCLHESVAESTVSGHDILDLTVKKPVDAAAHDGIAEIMKRPFVLCKIRGRKPVPHHHVRIVAKHLVRHLAGILHRVGVIAVHHDIALRLDFPEHTPDHISFPLHMLIPDHGSRLFCKFHSPVTGIIVIHINHCLRQRALRVLHHLGYGFLLVIARNQNRYFIH